ITSIGYDNSPRFPGGYFSHDGKPYYHQGNNAKVVDANGINEYDFAARQYVASQMRFTAPDPLAEERPGLSPYIYCNSNPIMLIHPSGKVHIPYKPNVTNYISLANIGKSNVVIDPLTIVQRAITRKMSRLVLPLLLNCISDLPGETIRVPMTPGLSNGINDMINALR
ncbi:MAG: hypothetical protein K2L34_06710, partial [Muribaculaceae bacterium]|nr:hypothetical protein [Muribaculaceae bacterium]